MALLPVKVLCETVRDGLVEVPTRLSPKAAIAPPLAEGVGLELELPLLPWARLSAKLLNVTVA